MTTAFFATRHGKSRWAGRGGGRLGLKEPKLVAMAIWWTWEKKRKRDLRNGEKDHREMQLLSFIHPQDTQATGSER